MAKPGPSTNGHLGNKDGWQATGYDYRDRSIEGFPCVHEFQVGGITLMPTTGKLVTEPGMPTDTLERKGYRSRFSHDDETATAGYYSVTLEDYSIRAELTSTPRVAYQRFTFPAADESHILFSIGTRMGESGAVKDAFVRLNDDGTIEGYVVTLPEYVKHYQPGAEVPIYFSAETDKQPTTYGVFNGHLQKPLQREGRGVGVGLYLTFPTRLREHTREREQVTVKIGISYTSIANARLNRETEAAGKSFDRVHREAERCWNEHLGRLAVEGKSEADKVKFYTGLYHALLGRGICSDVNGDYPRHDGSVGRVAQKNGRPAHNMYNTDAMWGGQWNLTQL